MPNACVKAVASHGKSLEKLVEIYSLSTELPKYLTSQVFFTRRLYAVNEQVLSSFNQVKMAIFNLLESSLSPLCTAPTITTNYIKE